MATEKKRKKKIMFPHADQTAHLFIQHRVSSDSLCRMSAPPKMHHLKCDPPKMQSYLLFTIYNDVFGRNTDLSLDLHVD